MPEINGRSDESFVIKVAPLVSSLDDKLKNASVSTPSSSWIFKTPSILFRHNENSFLPNSFSIGPIHHGKENLNATEEVKIKYLNGLLFRVIKSPRPEAMPERENVIERQKFLTNLILSVKLIEKRASACYAGHDFAAELAHNEFVKMMVLDGCFIIELFRKFAGEIGREPDDQIFTMSCMLQFLSHDLVLLENQVPWLVLETLFDQTKLPSESMPLVELTLQFFATMFTMNPPDPKKIVDCCKGKGIKHILDLLRLSQVLPSKEIKKKLKPRWIQIHSLTRLKEAGVEFEKTEADSILDIKFEHGCLKIPSLFIQETTETIFRNLIAYEQCLPNCPPIFTCYAKLLDNLIDTTNDMDILCKNKIYDNWLSPEDATQTFNKLYNDTSVKEFYYWSELGNDLDSYCKRRWPKWRASYVHNYFTKPWAIIAQIYAVIILFFTIWQTFIK
ncbi:hypothetical protein DITRI_Ditri16bG0141900 [Diplodiscus trichospermus]